MEIKREATEDKHARIPDLYSFKKKRRIEKGKLSIFIIGGFLLLFLGLLTFEFRYLSFDENTSLDKSQQSDQTVHQSNQDTYQSKQNKDNTKKSNALKLFKKENSKNKKNLSTLEKSTDNSDNFIKSFFSKKFVSFFSKKNATQKLEIDPESTKLVEKSQSEFFNSKIVNKEQHKYSLQIMAVEEEYKTKALKITKHLVKEGYQAYTYKTPMKIISDTYPNGKYFYRVRVGFFQTREEAKKTGDKIFHTNSSFPNDYYVIKAKSGEYDGKIITYGFQKN